LITKFGVESPGFLQPLADAEAPRVVTLRELRFKGGDCVELLVDNPWALPGSQVGRPLTTT